MRGWGRPARGAALGGALLVAACAPQAGPAPVTAAAPPVPLQDASPVEDTPPVPQAIRLANTASAMDGRWVRPAGRQQLGQASYYGAEFFGRTMANGRVFDPRSTSVAHRTLPFGTRVLVTNLGNGRTAAATVEDRGPFVQGRIIDLSPRLAEHLGMITQGVVPVEVVPVELAEAP